MARETQKAMIERLTKEKESLYQQLIQIQAEKDDKFLKSPAYEQFKRENELLKEQVRTLRKLLANADAREQKRNARGAGRKKADSKWQEGYNRFVELYKSQKSINETMEELNISRSTYFRYKKLYLEGKG